jgi:ATP-dependent DNA helicase RecG
MTTVSDLNRWLSSPHEGEHLEFKEAKNQYDTNKLFRYCVAIANEGGGKLILGVTDKPPRKVVGTQAFLNPSDIQSRILDKLRFRVTPEEVQHPDGRVLIFHIPPRPKGTAYHIDGSYLMRSTEDTVPMSEDRLRQIFAEGQPNWLLQSALSPCSADDLVRLLDTQAYFDMMKLPYPTDQKGVIERFEKETLIVRQNDTWAITNLGAVLFAKKLDSFTGLPRKGARVIVYEGTGKLKTKLDVPGTKGYAVGFQELIEFIQMQTTGNEIIEKAIRQTAKMYPEIAVRELVANALIHQDFLETGSMIMIEIYSDRIEISNPGLPLISIDRFIDEYKCRNEKLADILRRLGICEEKSSGIDKVVDAAEVYQLPAPDFRVGEFRTTAILLAHQKIEAMTRNDRIRACYQHCCLRYVTNQRMTNQSLRERFKLPEHKSDQVSRVIGDTIEANLIKVEDPSSSSKRYVRYLPFWA